MGIRRRPSEVLALCALAASVSSLACGVADDPLTPSATPYDASASREASDAGTIGPGVIPSDATVQNEASAPATDASDATDGPIATQDGDGAPDVVDLPTTDNEVCHVVWPQSAGVAIDTNNIGMAVDATGNAYLAIGYGGGDSQAPLDLGVTSAGYAQGFAVAKVDPACNLVWMREFGTSAADGSSASSDGIAVDANSNVRVIGYFTGSVDLGAALTSDASIVNDAGVNDAGTGNGVSSGFLMSLDGAGKTVFANVFRAYDGMPSPNLPVSLAVSPSGVATLQTFGGSGADFGNGPVAGPSPGTFDNYYLVQFDASGAVLREKALPSDGPSYAFITSDPGGGLWASGEVDSGSGSVQSLIRLTSDGDFTWSRPVAPSGGILAVNGTGEVFFSPSQSPRSLLNETVANYSTDGTLTSSHVTLVDYLGQPVGERVVLDANGNTIVGGSFVQTPRPSGAGFQRFDSSGILRSVTIWGGESAQLGALGVAPNGNVMIVGATTQPATTSPPPTVFFVRFVP